MHSSITIHMASLYFNPNITSSYEFTMSKLSAITYIIGLAIVLVFMALSFVIAVVWVKRKNETLFGMCKMLVKQKHKQISISSLTDQEPPSLLLDPILLQELKNLAESDLDKNYLKNLPGIDILKDVREWMDSLSFFQPFLIITFLLIGSQKSSFRRKGSDQYQSQSNDTFVLIGMTSLFISLLIYFLINCLRLVSKLIRCFSNQNAQISPLQENPTCNNLIKEPKVDETKTLRFITCKGIQTQVQIHEIAVQKISPPQEQVNDENSPQQKKMKKKVHQTASNYSHLFDVVYLIPLAISIVMALVNVF